MKCKKNYKTLSFRKHFFLIIPIACMPHKAANFYIILSNAWKFFDGVEEATINIGTQAPPNVH